MRYRALQLSGPNRHEQLVDPISVHVAGGDGQGSTRRQLDGSGICDSARIHETGIVGDVHQLHLVDRRPLPNAAKSDEILRIEGEHGATGHGTIGPLHLVQRSLVWLGELEDMR